MKLMPTTLLASLLAIEFTTQTFANEDQQKDDRRPPPPSFEQLDLHGDGDIDFDEFSSHEVPHGGSHAYWYNHQLVCAQRIK